MRTAILSGVALATFVSSSALAQVDSRGRGFPVGEKSRLHTGVDLGVGYDTNPSRETASVSDVRGSVRPGFSLDVPGNSFSMGLGAQLAFERLFGTNLDPHWEYGGNVTLRLRAGDQDSPVGFELMDSFIRTPTFLPELGAVGAMEIRLQQWFNRGLANMVFRPGGGALEFRAGYQNQLTIYDNLPDSQMHGITLEAKLKFLPKTAALFAAEFNFFSAESSVTAGAPEGVSATNDSTPYSVSIGLQGLLTSRLSTAVRLGFSDALTWQGDYFSTLAENSQRTITGRVEFGYALSDASDVSISYDRRVTPVIVLDSFVGDRIQGRARVGIGDRLALQGLVEYEFRGYREQTGVGATAEGKSAGVLTGDARVEYWFFDFLNAALSYRVLYQTADEGTNDAAKFLLEDFSRHLVMLDIGFRY